MEMEIYELQTFIIIIPFFIIFLIFAGLTRSSRRSYMAELRERVKALPLDEKTLEERLEIFDGIVAKNLEYKVKIRKLERLASGEEVSIKRKKKSLFKPLEDEIETEDEIDNMIRLGQLPSGTSFQCKFLPSSNRSHF